MPAARANHAQLSINGESRGLYANIQTVDKTMASEWFEDLLTLRDIDTRARSRGVPVCDIEEALAFYGSFLNFDLRSKSENAAFIYFGDQFINFAKGRVQIRPLA